MQYLTATEIINQAAAELGLTPASDPYTSADDAIKQLTALLDTSGQRLIYHYTWPDLVRQHTFTTTDPAPADGAYDLPDDFAYMIPQTGWMRDQNVPLFGPLSEQDWQYLLGRDLVSSTIYASFRLNLNKLRIFPTEGIGAQEIAYEYMARNWVAPANSVGDPSTYTSKVSQGSDFVLYPVPLAMLYLKARFLMAKGFDTTKADAEFSDAFMVWSGLSKSAPILRLDGFYDARGGAVPYLNGYCNVPDTGYGR